MNNGMLNLSSPSNVIAWKLPTISQGTASTIFNGRMMIEFFLFVVKKDKIEKVITRNVYGVFNLILLNLVFFLYLNDGSIYFITLV